MMYRRMIACVVSFLAVVASAHAGFQAMALTGQIPPDSGGVSFGHIGTVSVDRNGEVVFFADLNTGSATGTATYRTVGGVPQKIVRRGDEPPGLPGAKFNFPGTITYSDIGSLAFNQKLQLGQGGVTAGNDQTLWVDQGNGLEMIAREGFTAPDTGGGLFEFLNDPILGPNGDLAFVGTLLLGGGVFQHNGVGIWTKSPGGELGLAVRQGDPTPGIAGGAFGNMSFPSVNSSGDIAFNAAVVPVLVGARGSGIDSENDSGIWRSVGGSKELVVREGEAAIGAAGFEFRSFQSPLINASADLAFIGRTRSQVGGLRGFGSGVWTESGGDFTMVAHTGGEAPGAGGADFVDMNFIKFNDAGDVAFHGEFENIGGFDVEGPPSGIWLHHEGALDAIAVTGDTAPGTDGARFEGFASPVLGAHGDVVFEASLLYEGDVTFDNVFGVWAYAAPSAEALSRGEPGQFIKVVRKGDSFEVAPGDVRVIDFAQVQGSVFEAFQPTPAINGSRQLALQLGFTDGTSGVFLFQLPAPGAGIVFLIAGVLGVQRRSR